MKLARLPNYESHHQPLAPWPVFLRRLRNHLSLALALTLFSLVLGTAGYHWLGGLAWIDALLNASMLLGGMGPVGDLTSVGGKLFASFYALYAGLVFIAVSGIVLSPLLHRVLHRIHLRDDH